MSNIITTYLRIRKTNDTHLSERERERLFRALVNWNGEFGSYYVKVVKRYREKEKCLEIQFGSGKQHWEDPADYLDDKSEVEVIKRSSNEGSLDKIQFSRYKDGGEFETVPKLCTYAFDRIVMLGDTNWLGEEGMESVQSGMYTLDVSGTYYSANFRGFVDMRDNGSSEPMYDEDYPYAYCVLTKTEEIQFTAPDFMVDLTESNFSRMPDGTKMIFYYQGREVAVIAKNDDQLERRTADYWDNCEDLKTWEESDFGHDTV
ncbi:hypothetical protein [Chitinophaga sancti]|uniref:Uncharacterized protein n=1 Tax=Chitinophaga sancti TaxID=1004 RepID=A0A1K1NK09_9BACT|nr:hypothetical protein [Chitinophaga sancti]WQD63160.1 hypothetical protein U0033_02040 [Chitinophaga sancti]WQG91215.1 hypothetical protein SR876_06875 [Chitinophaga sancti]SFW35623.1 hypothetical protein SAMN05661012_01375 [Chitinophaga sancti]